MAQPSLAARAAIALLLMVGFYVLAVLLAAGLLGIVYLDFASGHIQPKLIIICVAAAGMILWSILPRRDKFLDPGPKLTPSAHPSLFKEIRSLAAATQQHMPAEVFLVPDMNAWVAQRGGVMGFGSKRVMGLGLTLLQTLNISQFRAVLAHEFGHYHGGDTSLGPFIYKTRNAMRRTIRNLAEADSILTYVFMWYGNLFLRVTQAISRRQELAADELAARVVGPQHLASGLVAIHGAAAAADSFWANEISPIIKAGYVPPLVEGFTRFLASENIKESMQRLTETELKTRKGDKFDSHPPLADRLDGAKKFALPGELARTEPAFTLLNNPERVESELLRFLIGREEFSRLKAVGWDSVAEKVYMPQWRETVARNKDFLAGLTAHALPGRASNYADLCAGKEVMFTAQLGQELIAIGCALTLAALRAGATLHAGPGEMSVEKAGATFDPFNILPQLALKKLPHVNWQQTARDFGISDLDLSQTGEAVATASAK